MNDYVKIMYAEFLLYFPGLKDKKLVSKYNRIMLEFSVSNDIIYRFLSKFGTKEIKNYYTEKFNWTFK